MLVQRAAMFAFVLLDGGIRPDVLHLDAVTRANALAQLQRFGELIARIEVEQTHARLDLRQHVDETATLCPERRRHRQLGEKGVDCPAHNQLGRGIPELFRGGQDLLRRQGECHGSIVIGMVTISSRDIFVSSHLSVVSSQ